MAGGGHDVCADGLHAASLPKQVSAAELRACLHVSSAHSPCKCLLRLRIQLFWISWRLRVTPAPWEWCGRVRIVCVCVLAVQHS
jgi:hypothetical protein